MQIVLQHVSVPRPYGEDAANRAREFYGGLLGLTEKPVPSTIVHLGLVWFKIGEETELHVFSEADSDQKSGRHFCLNVGDVEAMRQKLIDSGYEPWNPEGIMGRPRFFCRDPFGNVIEFTQIVDDYMKFQSGD